MILGAAEYSSGAYQNWVRIRTLQTPAARNRAIFDNLLALFRARFILSMACSRALIIEELKSPELSKNKEKEERDKISVDWHGIQCFTL